MPTRFDFYLVSLSSFLCLSQLGLMTAVEVSGVQLLLSMPTNNIYFKQTIPLITFLPMPSVFW